MAKKIFGIKAAVSDYERLNAAKNKGKICGELMFNTISGYLWVDEWQNLGNDKWRSGKSYSHTPGVVFLGHRMHREGIEKITEETVRNYIEHSFLEFFQG